MSESRTNILPGILSRQGSTGRHTRSTGGGAKRHRGRNCVISPAEAYQWLLVPTQTSPQGEPDWKAFRLSGQDPLAVRASEKLRIDAVSAVVLPRNASAEMMPFHYLPSDNCNRSVCQYNNSAACAGRGALPLLEFPLFEALLTGRFIALMERTSSHEKSKSPAELKL